MHKYCHCMEPGIRFDMSQLDFGKSKPSISKMLRWTTWSQQASLKTIDSLARVENLDTEDRWATSDNL